MLGLFLLGYIGRHVRRPHAMVGVIIGVLVIGWISLAGPLNLPGPQLHEYLAIVLGTVAIFLTGFLLAMVFSNKKKML